MGIPGDKFGNLQERRETKLSQKEMGQSNQWKITALDMQLSETNVKK